MKSDLPALDLLKAFEAAARHLSFTHAASELYLSQSAISRQIQQLETQLGAALFVRRTRALLLTDAGQRYHRDVQQALQQLRAAGTALKRAPASRVVTITTSVTFASLWLVPRLAGFQQHHPEIEIRIAADNIIRDLDHDRIDVAIRYSTRRSTGQGAQRLFGERVLPVCSPRLAGAGSLRRVEDLKRFVLLHFADLVQRTPWLSWDIWFEAMKTPPPKPKGELRFSQYDMMLNAAINGQGVALGRVPVINSVLASGALVAPLSGERFRYSARDRAYWMMTSQEAHKRDDVRIFTNWLRDQSAALVSPE